MAVCTREGNVSQASFQFLRQPVVGYPMAEKQQKRQRPLLMKK
jgi:hypothetical protein